MHMHQQQSFFMKLEFWQIYPKLFMFAFFENGAQSLFKIIT